MSTSNRCANLLLKGWAYKDYHYFFNHLKSAKDIQLEILKDNLQRNREKEFGRKHQFSKIKNIIDYHRNVPIRKYEDFIDYIEKIKLGESGILTRDDVLLFEPTGGSTGGSKLIPYTAHLKSEFRKSINVWLFDIFHHYPALLSGSSYWSISPHTHKPQKTPGGISIGFESDAAYLGIFGKVISRLFPVPEAVKKVKNIENFRQISSVFLLASSDLSLISVWNPTFLLLVLNYITDNTEVLLKSIFDGKIYSQYPEDISFLNSYLKKLPSRAKELEGCFNLPENEIFQNIWPQLKLISCWKEGTASQFINKLEYFFPNVFIQGKGLLATEAFITLPLFEANGCLPAYTSHFLEFRSSADGSVYLLDELETGESYSVIVTTGGGLYRYDLGDIVRITGKYCGLPILKFDGRLQTCDLVGEKLQENFVQNVLIKALFELQLNAQFVFLAPVVRENEQFYGLFIELLDNKNRKKISVLKDNIENRLNLNFHYKYARDLNQLGPVRVFLISGDAIRYYEKRCTDEGQKSGDIKPVYLDTRTAWESFFPGEFI